MRLATKASLCSALFGLLVGTSSAQAQNSGFQLNRYEPTAAGEWSFAVDHPWYSSTRYFAAGLTLNYGHNPLVVGFQNGDKFEEQNVLLSHGLLAHVDLAGSFLDRFLITASLPVVLVNQGPDIQNTVSVGDPRLGLMARLFGQPYKSAFSVSIGAQVWIPLRKWTDLPVTVSDQDARVLPKIVLGGVWKKLLWSGTAGFLYRPEAEMPPLTAAASGAEAGRVGSELQFGVAAAYYDAEKRFSIGPEVVVSTTALGKDNFSRYGTSVEGLIGGQYNIAKMVQVGLAGGLGFVRQPGTPDGRVLLRIAYAPIRGEDKDTDGDGIVDRYDACPTEPGVKTNDRRTNGCPQAADRDQDGVPDAEDMCPDVHKGPSPDPARIGCPMAPPAPPSDRDQDGIPDDQDQCPDVHKGPTPDPQRIGCPAQDSDKDGFLDPVDQCLFEPAGLRPDETRPGCPLPDRDKDTVPDREDACPDKFGAPHPDPKKNGCPGLVEVKNGQLVILKPVFFATDKDIILAQSFPVLQAVADAMRSVPNIKKVGIEGHTDSQGKYAYNIDLSDRRAKSVMKWLTTKGGVEASRLEAKGFGPTRPVADNKTAAGRAKNRRVEFHIVDGSGTVEQAN